MTRSSPVARTVGFGAAVAVLLPGLLADGGLAPLVVACVAALGFGVPVARTVWRRPDAPAGLRDALASTADLVAWALVAAAGATAVAPLAPWGPLAVLAAWALGAATARWVGAGHLAAVAIAGIGLAGLAAAAGGRTETLLTPVWSPHPGWAGAAALGLLGAGVVGPFTAGPDRPPGERHAPVAVVGALTVVATSLSLWAAARYGTALGQPSEPWGAGLGLLATGAGAAAWLSWRPSRRPLPRATAGALGALWLAGPGAAGLPFLLGAVLPTVAGLWLAARALSLAGTERALLGGVGALLLVCPWLGAVPVPEATGDAVALAALGVVGFWIVATGWLLRTRVAA